MSYSSVTAVVRGRPRDDAREAEILRVVLELLSEKGLDHVTFEEVARRSRASKSTLYRRWHNRRDMVVAAVRRGTVSGTELSVNTGSLRGDLLDLCRRLVTTLNSADGRLVVTLLQAGLEDPALCDLLESSAGPTGARLPAEVLEGAIARGELPAGASAFAFEEVVGSALVLRRLNGLPTDETYLVQLVDAIVLPALNAPPTTPADHRGIFSGHPRPSG